MSTHNDFVNNIPTPNNAANAMQNYTQKFIYDELGNMMQMKSVGKWTRDYFYAILKWRKEFNQETNSYENQPYSHKHKAYYNFDNK